MLLAGLVAGDAHGKGFITQSEALALAFPDAEEVKSTTFVLDDDQVARIESLARCEVDSKLVKCKTVPSAGKGF